MKYLRPKKKNCKIKIAPNSAITVMMYDVVRVKDDKDSKGRTVDGEVTIMSITGKEMLYQDKPRMKVKRKYILGMLDNSQDFKITDSFKFINLI